MNRTRVRPAWRWIAALSILLAALSGRPAAAQTSPAKGPAEQEKEVRALFEANCFRCHSHQAGKSKGGLMLDSLSAMQKGGDNGPAVVPGDPDKGLLVKAIGYHDDELKMPPKGKLADEEIALVR